MANLENRKIENGWIIGTVRTDKVGSECDFEVCTVEEWEELEEKDTGKIVIEALNESGILDVLW